MKTKIIANWKMNMLAAEAVNFLAELQLTESVDIGIAPPATLLQIMSTHVGRQEVMLLGQNVHEANHGAYTGELSTSMLREAGAEGSLIGHSERRELFHETDEDVQKKIERSLCENFSIILCVGETEAEREAGKTNEVLTRQVTTALESCFDEKHWALVTLAYEPVWAIGTGLAATVEQIEEAHKMIRAQVAKLSSEEIASNVSILYGGSVTPDNFPEIIQLHNVDGALVGGASLKAETFNTLIQQGSVTP